MHKAKLGNSKHVAAWLQTVKAGVFHVVAHFHVVQTQTTTVYCTEYYSHWITIASQNLNGNLHS